MVRGYHTYWAKSGEQDGEFHRLPYHLLDVAASMRALLRSVEGAVEHIESLFGIEAGAEDLLIWLAGLHDLGKFANSFQSLAPAIQTELGGRSTGVPYTARHDALGGYLLRRLATSRDSSDWLKLDGQFARTKERRSVTHILLEAIAGHHGAPCASHNRHELERAFTIDDLAAADEFVREWSAMVSPDPVWEPDIATSFREKVSRGSWIAAGWMVLADWLGSNRDFFPYQKDVVSLAEYWTRAQRLAECAVRESGVLAPRPRAFEGLETLFPGFKPSPMQRFAETVKLADGPQLFVLEDATGSGKTEAALVLASRLMNAGLANGVYIGLPTTATANGMFARMREAYQRFFVDPNASIVLAHSSRQLEERFREVVALDAERLRTTSTYGEGDSRAEAVCTAWLGDSARRALLAPFGVGTVDQALLAGLPVRYQALRLAGLSRKVLIVDEVHSYDVYMVKLLENVVRYHAEQSGSVILLSATLSRDARQSLVDAFHRGLSDATLDVGRTEFPLATHVAASSLEEHPVDTRGSDVRPQVSHRVGVRLAHDPDEAFTHLLQTAEAGRCGCWIRNTVDEATAAYEQLRARFRERGVDPDRVTLFHARFARCDRQAIERDVLHRFGKTSSPTERAGRIVVATQVIEQSLDLDFDAMVTDLAPIDLVIQRAGRLHRHDHRPERPAPELVVLSPSLEGAVEADWYGASFAGAQWVYRDHALLWRTATLLDRLGEIAIPSAARTLIEGVYGEESLDIEVPESLLESENDALAQDLADGGTAKFAALDFAAGYSNVSSDRWLDDSRTPTRLGHPTVRLRLARVTEAGLEPLADEGRFAWSLSEVTVPASKFDRIAVSEGLQNRVEAAAQAMFDRAKYVEVVPLSISPDGRLTCPVEDRRGRPLVLAYSNETGLQFLEE